MKSTLYVTADDFGLHPAINEGILKLHNMGVVNRVSIIVGTEYFKESVSALKKTPRLEVGVHLNLTDGRPILHASNVRSLVNKRGGFIGGRHIAVATGVMFGALSIIEIRAEWSAQIDRAKRAGLKITFLNSHGHIHLLPQLQDVILDLAVENNIKYIRVILNASELKGYIYKVLSKRLIQKIKDRKLEITYPAAVYGVDHQGHLDKGIIESELKKRKKSEIAELITHPASHENEYHTAWGYATKQEYESLVSISELGDDN